MEEIYRKIGIFILNYNGILWLKKNLKHLVNYSENADIIVIDNKSSDQSVNYINETFPSVKIKINKKNYGFAKGYNEVLLKEINFNYFILINNDVEVTKNWITPMLEILEKEDVGIVQPKILNFENKEKFDYAGGGGGFIDILGIPFCRGRILNNIEDDNNQYNDNIDIYSPWDFG